MRLWQYHVLSMIAGLLILTICAFVMPVLFLIFMFFGYWVALLLTAYILGRMVLSHALPGTYKKIMESRCQRPHKAA